MSLISDDGAGLNSPGLAIHSLISDYKVTSVPTIGSSGMNHCPIMQYKSTQIRCRR